MTDNENNENAMGEKSDKESEEDESDESDEDTGNNEVEFRFEDFLKRLVNPKVVQACTVVLGDWERLPARTIKSAVTLLHRIAFGCKVPIMLFQVALFRIFQQVFDAPKDVRYDEIRRLGVFIMRTFVDIAKTNPKVYAELFFYKNVREANDIEYGYDDQRYAQGGSKKTGWTEEQEEELRTLFMENQNNPSTEKDVIDWILDNLIDKNRTRRAVIKKMKELGLIFKAPTRKSVAAAVNKHLWKHEEDTLLKELYDEHRLDDDCLIKIMESFVENRSRNAVIKRMIELGLIANRVEILPSKRRKSNKNQGSVGSEDESSGNDSSDSDESSTRDTRKVKVTVKTTKKAKGGASKLKQASSRPLNEIKINVADVQRQIDELEESIKVHFPWIQESLNDAAEDADENDDLTDPSDGVPIVPFSVAQKEALDNIQFKKILLSLGLQEPIKEMETYWRIPVNMSAHQMRLAAKVLSGEPMEDDRNAADDNFERLYVSDSEDESFTEIEVDRQNRLQKARDLIYNDSDNEDERQSISKSQNTTKEVNSFDLLRSGAEQMDDEDVIEPVNDQHRSVVGAATFDSEEFNSQVIRRRLAELDDSDDESDNGTVSGISEATTNGDSDRLNATNKRERSIPEETSTFNNGDDDNDDDDDDDDEVIMLPQKKKPKLSIIDDDSDED